MATSSSFPERYAFLPPYVEKNLLASYQRKEGPHAAAAAEGRVSSKSAMQGRSIAFATDTRRQKFEIKGAVALGGPSQHAAIPAAKIEVWHGNTNILLRSSAQPQKTTTDVAANNCYDNCVKTDNFYRSVFSIPPVDNASKLMKNYVHHPQAYNNAFWMPLTETVYFGEVDTDIFTPFVDNLDITVHEYGHAVTHFSSNLDYEYQSGALNESISDVFAIMAKQRLAGTKADDRNCNWLIGEVIKGYSGTALRSMKAPGQAFKNHPDLGSDMQPAHMSDFLRMTDDNGGVHYNSGIPNRAFYLAASRIGGNSWEKPGQIWYKTLINSGSSDDFAVFAQRTKSFAKSLYGGNIENIVGQAWQDVGVDLRAPFSPRAGRSSFPFLQSILLGLGIAGGAYYLNTRFNLWDRVFNSQPEPQPQPRGLFSRPIFNRPLSLIPPKQ